MTSLINAKSLHRYYTQGSAYEYAKSWEKEDSQIETIRIRFSQITIRCTRVYKLFVQYKFIRTLMAIQVP
jgi:hypothetical protein